MDNPSDHRKSRRNPVALPAGCRTVAGMRDNGELSDLSEHGCCLTTRSLHLSIGMRLTIKPEGMQGLTGVVRWIAGDRAGIEFDEPLYLPVAEHLAFQNARLRRAVITRPFV